MYVGSIVLKMDCRWWRQKCSLKATEWITGYIMLSLTSSDFDKSHLATTYARSLGRIS